MPASEERDRAYAEVIGAKFDAFDDTSAEPPLRVRRYTGKPVTNGPVCDIWVTSGMSDLPMEDDDGDSLRRELIFYAPHGWQFHSGAARGRAFIRSTSRKRSSPGCSIQRARASSDSPLDH